VILTRARGGDQRWAGSNRRFAVGRLPLVTGVEHSPGGAWVQRPPPPSHRE